MCIQSEWSIIFSFKQQPQQHIITSEKSCQRICLTTTTKSWMFHLKGNGDLVESGWFCIKLAELNLCRSNWFSIEESLQFLHICSFILNLPNTDSKKMFCKLMMVWKIRKYSMFRQYLKSKRYIPWKRNIENELF